MTICLLSCVLVVSVSLCFSIPQVPSGHVTGRTWSISRWPWGILETPGDKYIHATPFMGILKGAVPRGLSVFMYLSEAVFTCMLSVSLSQTYLFSLQTTCLVLFLFYRISLQNQLECIDQYYFWLGLFER